MLLYNKDYQIIFGDFLKKKYIYSRLIFNQI